MSAPAKPLPLPQAIPPPNIPVVEADMQCIQYDAPSVLPTAPPCASTACGNNNKEEECSICLEALSSEPAVHIKACRHVFHQACLFQSHLYKCPICRTPIAENLCGTGPSGTMHVAFHTRQSCPGFPSADGTIQITYTIPSGTQMDYHETPGLPYQGATRVAYLPNHPPGRALLARLQYSFLHGHSFRIGTSLTTGVANCVTWTSVHHKTSLHGGTHGFPDASYLANCHGSLDALGVPRQPSEFVVHGKANRRNANIKLVYTAPMSLHESIEWPLVLEPYLVPQQQKALQPSGTLRCETMDTPCPGFPNTTKTIQLDYHIPSGRQASYHPSPGHAYAETTRVAYLPDNDDGRGLLRRLVYAWSHGLVFSIGVSLTTGLEAVVWTGIPHKTILHHNCTHKTNSNTNKTSAFAFPDDTYIATCHKKLDALGVPGEDEC